MTLPIAIALAGTVFARAHVRRLHFRHALGEPWSARVEVAATDVDLDLDAIIGESAQIQLEGEPLLPAILGIVRAARQSSAEKTGESTYVLDLAPSCSFLELRRSQRIFQHLDVRAVLAQLLGEHDLRPALAALREDHPAHEYLVQWKESDLAFCQRLLAEEGITLVVDPRDDSIRLFDDSTTGGEVAATLPVLPDAQAMRASDEPPCVRSVGVGRTLEAARLAVRDFDFEHPEFTPESHAGAGEGRGREHRLDVYEMQVGDFRDEAGAALAGRRRLQALRARTRTIELGTNVAVAAGTRLAVQGSQRAGVDGELLVLSSETSWTDDTRRTVLQCIPVSVPFRPARRPKPRIHGTQTAFVVTPDGKDVDVDAYGRVEVEFRWDRRDTHSAGASRRVRVSQPWAGAGFGMTLLPRRNEEVVVAYLDGDPDEPIIVGRVHDGVLRDPLDLPAQQTQSIWKSRSVPAPPEGDAYNMVRMEDAAGGEMLELRAQRDFRSETLRNAETVVGVDEKKKVGGSSKTEVAGPYSLQSASTAISTGPYQVQSTECSISSTGNMKLTAGGARRDTSANHNIETGGLWVNASEIVQVVAPTVKVMAGEIILEGGGSTVVINGAGVTINGAVVDVHGAPIKLNC
jgi:type VI secretion system secreted protein VgrG